METWLIVAAEAREFAGLLKRASEVRPLPCPEAAFAREIMWRGDRWMLLANGPGPRLVDGMLSSSAIPPWHAHQVVSVGFCGALDPALHVGDIVIWVKVLRARLIGLCAPRFGPRTVWR